MIRTEAESAVNSEAEMKETSYKETTRQQESILAPLEKRVLLRLAQAMPSRVNSDHLTALGLFAMFLAGASLAVAGWVPWTPLLLPLLLALNWFGDSLDGTLARVRNKQRPRYGYYVDHVVDAFNTLFLFGGLALSGLMTPVIALSILAAYYLLCIDSYLVAHAIGRFKISYFKFSPTELRILFAIGFVYVWFKPMIRVLGKEWLFFDVAALVAIPLMLMTAILSVIHNTRTLYDQERI